MKKFSKVKRLFPIFLLLFVELLLFLTNYSSGTYLLGWDNLFPEINFKENIIRSFFAVWQEYRGLGFLDGMSFAANLPHYLFLYFLSLFVPHNLLRYLFIFFMHLLGGVGAYLLIKELLDPSKYRKVSAFLGGLFYLFNLATVQMFFAPYEPFTVHFAFLPLLCLAIIRYLRDASKKNLIWFVILSLFSIPQAHIPTLFIVYLIAILSFVGVNLFFSKKSGVKRWLIILFLTFTINSFWGLPYFYSALQNAEIISNSKINQMATEDIFLKNKAYGDFTNTSLLKGFSLDFIDIKTPEMMASWKDHSQTPFFVFLGFSLFALAIFGLASSVYQKKRGVYPFVLQFIFFFSMLGINIPVLSSINSFLNSYIPYFLQVFRFSFTKFSIIYSLSLCVFFSLGLSVLFNKFKKTRRLNFFFITIILLGFLYYSLPSWQGKFLYKNLKLKLPNEYVETVNFFVRQNQNGRTAILPQPTFRDWTYTNWGYRGSGFLWYGIPQPTLDGAFYPWSKENENYYWEISYALYSKNRELFEKVLEKYQINWLLVDGNVINPPSPKALFIDELEEMISKSNKFSLAQEFGKIKIYQANLETPVKDFVFMAENLPTIGPDYKWNNYDQAYSEKEAYITNSQLPIPNYQTYFPFRSLFTGRSQEDLEFEIEDRGEYFFFRKAIPESTKNYQLSIPEDGQQELIWVDPQDLSKVRYLKPEVKIKDNAIEVIVPKVGGYYGAEIDPTKELTVQKAVNCQEYLNGQVANEIIEENGKKLLRLSAVDAKNCGTSFWLPNLNHGLSYLITIESRNLEGKSLLFWLENLNSRRADLETYLPKQENVPRSGIPLSGRNSKPETSYFIQPPMEEDGLGYTLHLDNLSIGRVKSVNDLGKISVNPIPYKFLTSLKLVNPQAVFVEPQLHEPVEVYHPNPSYYKIQPSTINHQSSTILVLSQAYHDGWLAWEGKPFIGKRLQHVEVNNWENGWVLPDHQSSIINHQSSITILFWPQLLEYFGFILLGGTLLGVGIYCLRKK